MSNLGDRYVGIKRDLRAVGRPIRPGCPRAEIGDPSQARAIHVDQIDVVHSRFKVRHKGNLLPIGGHHRYGNTKGAIRQHPGSLAVQNPERLMAA